MSKRKPDCSVIIVSHQHRKYLYECLQSLMGGMNGLRSEIIVIDNRSTDGTVESLNHDILSNITLIRNTRNLGYAKACNLGISIAKSDVILLLNPDVLVGHDSIGRLLRFLRHHRHAACVVPVLNNYDGTIQYSCRKFPGLKDTLLKRTPLRWFVDLSKTERYDEKILTLINNKEIFRIDWALGGCLMANKSTFEKLGCFDERFFLYCEDIDWFYRLKKAGFTAYCFPDVALYHKHLAASDHRLFSVESLHHTAGIVKFVIKHFSDILGGRYPPIDSTG